MHLSSLVGNMIIARALLAAALSNDFVKLRLQLQKQSFWRVIKVAIQNVKHKHKNRHLNEKVHHADMKYT